MMQGLFLRSLKRLIWYNVWDMVSFWHKKQSKACILAMIFFVLFSFIIFVMLKTDRPEEEQASFFIYDRSRDIKIIPEEKEGMCRIYLPSGFSLSEFKLVKDDQTILEDLSALNNENKLLIDGKEYLFDVVETDGISSLFIDVKTGDIDKVNADEYKNEKARALLQVIDEKGNADLEEYASIKGRGNTSWRFYEKKPYNIRFDSDVSILGMSEDKHWALLANEVDGTEIDNALVYDFARKLDLSYVPDYRYTNVYIDGKYNGLYLLSERIEVSNTRLDLKRDSSYLLEIDLNAKHDLLDNYFISEGNNLVEIHYPQIVSDSFLAVIENEVNDFEAALKDLESDRWKEMIDIDSFARVYLIDELFENVDGGYCSVFFYKGDDGKLVRGPLWDYDRCFGYSARQIMAGNARKYGNQLSDSYNYWLLKREEFKDRVRQIYEKEFLPVLQDYGYARIDEIQRLISSSYNADCIRWDREENIDSYKKIQPFLEQRSLFLSDYFENEDRYVKLQIEDELHYLNNFILEKGSSIYDAYDLDKGLLNTILYEKESGEVFNKDRAVYDDLCLVRGEEYETYLPDLSTANKENVGFFNLAAVAAFLFCFGLAVHIIRKRI